MGHEDKDQEGGGSMTGEWEQVEKEQGASGTVDTNDKVAPVAWLSFHE